jgi:hypothetical protein
MNLRLNLHKRLLFTSTSSTSAAKQTTATATTTTTTSNTLTAATSGSSILPHGLGDLKDNYKVKRGPGGRSSKSGHIATVFGCSGFLGRYLVHELGTYLPLPLFCLLLCDVYCEFVDLIVGGCSKEWYAGGCALSRAFRVHSRPESHGRPRSSRSSRIPFLS